MNSGRNSFRILAAGLRRRPRGGPMSLPRLALPLAGALLAVPLVAGGLPSALAAPTNPTAAQGAAASGFLVTSDETTEPTADSRVVVAVIDSATNPYHEFFQVEQSSVTPDVLAEFGIGPEQTITLTRTGNFAKDYAADKARVWDKITPETPYWFTGTNIIATSFDPGSRPILPDDARDTHGVGTTAAVLKANPEAVTVLVEGINDASETWAFTHPAVDIVTTSYGVPGSLPLGFHLNDSYTGVVELGKVHTGAADNSPALSQPDGTSGPWWTVGVAGFEEGTSEGRQAGSGNAVDFVGDFTQDLPYCFDCEKGEKSVGGTSFATPRSAGTISTVLLEARRAAGHVGGIVTDGVEQPSLIASGDSTLTTWQLRRAMEEAAYFPTTAEYDPIDGVLTDRGGVPVLDAAPWLQTGWGAITPDPEHGVVTEALARLGVGDEPTRTKTAANCDYQTANIEARQAYWDNVATDSESLGTTKDPFVYC
jgi:hypothetical protein